MNIYLDINSPASKEAGLLASEYGSRKTTVW